MRTDHHLDRLSADQPIHISASLTLLLTQLQRERRETTVEETEMSSTRVAINRVVITGRAVTDPVTKTVKSHHGETTLTVFSIRTTKDTYVGSVIMEIQAWSRCAAQANLVAKGREVAIDGQLTQNEYLGPDGRKQTRTAIRADRLQLLGESDTLA
jgi:capsular polysaccharide biosynthesis protein